MHSATTLTRPSSLNVISGHVMTIDTISRQKITFFDSFGRFEQLPYPHLKRALLNNARTQKRKLVTNNIDYQLPETTICGHLSIYFLLLRARGFSLEQIQKKKLSLNQYENLIAVPEIIEGLLPRHIQAKRKHKKRYNWRLFSP